MASLSRLSLYVGLSPSDDCFEPPNCIACILTSKINETWAVVHSLIKLDEFSHDQGETEAAEAKSHLLPLGMTKFA